MLKLVLQYSILRNERFSFGLQCSQNIKTMNVQFFWVIFCTNTKLNATKITVNKWGPWDFMCVEFMIPDQESKMCTRYSFEMKMTAAAAASTILAVWYYNHHKKRNSGWRSSALIILEAWLKFEMFRVSKLVTLVVHLLFSHLTSYYC